MSIPPAFVLLAVLCGVAFGFLVRHRGRIIKRQCQEIEAHRRAYWDVRDDLAEQQQRIDQLLEEKRNLVTATFSKESSS